MKICEIPNCGKKVQARGLCAAHYSQLRRTGSPTGSMKTRDPDGFVPKEIKTTCSVGGCDSPHLCQGFCSRHYQRWVKYGDPNVVTTRGLSAELCSKCGVNERRLTHSWCLPCQNDEGRKRNASEKGPRWRRYKLTRQDIFDMKDAQLNSCMICGDSFDVVEDHVDHDNKCCGKEKTRNSGTCGECIRDLLCGSCNQGLGNFKDSIERLESAIQYLRKWSKE